MSSKTFDSYSYLKKKKTLINTIRENVQNTQTWCEGTVSQRYSAHQREGSWQLVLVKSLRPHKARLLAEAKEIVYQL